MAPPDFLNSRETVNFTYNISIRAFQARFCFETDFNIHLQMTNFILYFLKLSKNIIMNRFFLYFYMQGSIVYHYCSDI